MYVLNEIQDWNFEFFRSIIWTLYVYVKVVVPVHSIFIWYISLFGALGAWDKSKINRVPSCKAAKIIVKKISGNSK